MRKILISILLLILPLVAINAQGQPDQYRRSSVYNILLQHPAQKYVNEVREVYYEQPLNDKFNDHSLSILSVLSSEEKTFQNIEDITQFLNDNHVAQRLVAKWFDREKETGTFDPVLISQRGYYNASQLDLELSALTKRNTAMLADAGEELISNTFVVVYDIVYIDKEEQAQKAKRVLGVFADIADVVGGAFGAGSIGSSISSLVKSTVDLAGSISDMISGFAVKITTHLYQLEWNNDVANTFYSDYYLGRGEIDMVKSSSWRNSGDYFKLKYIDSRSVRSGKTVARGLYSPQDVIRKVVYRALDESICDLQESNEVFRSKFPIVKVDGNKVYAYAGMKEGIEPTKVYEVLEQTFKNNSTVYKRVGVIKPVSNEILDNRYMAKEEEAEGAELKYTTFEIKKGGNFYPGLLIREGISNSLNGKTITNDENLDILVPPTPAKSTLVKAETQISASQKEEQPYTRTLSPKLKEKIPTQSINGYEGRTFIMANVGMDFADISNFSSNMVNAGIMGGWAKRFGFYIKGKYNFASVQPYSNSYSYEVWTTGESKISTFSVTAGGIFRFIPAGYIYLGAGYGQRKLFWEDIDRRWVEIADGSAGPFCADLGVGFFLGKVSLSVGASAFIGERFIDVMPEIGIGVNF